MTIYYTASIPSGNDSDTLTGTITVSGSAYLILQPSVTDLEAYASYTKYVDVLAISYGNDDFIEVAMFSDGIYISAAKAGGTFDHFTSMAITGTEFVTAKFDFDGAVTLNVDGVEVYSGTSTGWLNAFDHYFTSLTATGSCDVWISDASLILLSNPITEGYGLPNNIITEGYGVGSEVIPDPPDPPTSVYVVTVAAGLGGSTDVLPDTYNALSGSSFSITATPSAGYGFLYYDTGTEHISSNPYTFTVTASVTLTPIYGISSIDPTDRFGNLVSAYKTPAVFGTAKFGFTRFTVKVPIFDGALEQIIARVPVETIDGVKTLPTFRQALNKLKGE